MRGTVRAAAAALLVALTTLVLLGPGAATPGTVAVAVLTVVLAVLARTGARSLRPVHVHGPARPLGDATPPPRAGRATDPAHHPLRPRAPGQA
jgi:hypothetical protein